MKAIETMVKNRLEYMQTEPGQDLWNRILESAKTGANTSYTGNVQPRKKRTVIPKLIACTAAMILLFCMLNITTVLAFIKNLFFIPGVGVTDNDMAVVLLKEPVEIDCEIGRFTVEFGTKVIDSDGKCEVMLFLTTKENIYASGVYIEDLNAKAIIDGEEYILDHGTFLGGGGYNTTICVKNIDFPDINEFDLTFEGATARIIMTEMTEEEKTPYLSRENNGITLAAYKYRNNNNFIGFDVINNNRADGFTSISARLSDLGGAHVYDKNGGEITLAGGSLNRGGSIFESGLANGLLYLNNKDNAEVKKITADSIIVNYHSDFENPANFVTLPIPKDGETIYTDIEVPAGGAAYKITEVRREGDVIYFKDNVKYSYNDSIDREKAAENCEAYITNVYLLKVYGFDHITGFNPDDDYVIIPVLDIEVTYYGDFTINFDERIDDYEK